MKTGAIYLEELEKALARKVRYMRRDKRAELKPIISMTENAFAKFRSDLESTPDSMKLRAEERGNVIPPQSTFYNQFLALHLSLLPPTEIEQQLNYCQTKFAGNYYVNGDRGFITLLSQPIKTNLLFYSIFAHRNTAGAIKRWKDKMSENGSTVASNMIEFKFEGDEKERIVEALSQFAYEQDLVNLPNLFEPGYVLPIYFNCPTNLIVDLFSRIRQHSRTANHVTQKHLCNWLCAKVGTVVNGVQKKLHHETVLSAIKRRDRAPKKAILPDLFSRKPNRKGKRSNKSARD